MGLSYRFSCEIQKLESSILELIFQLQRKDKKVLCTYLVFIKENIGQPGVTESEVIRLFKECIAVVTKRHNAKQPSKEVVHFNSEYKSSPDLEGMFPGIILYTVDFIDHHNYTIPFLFLTSLLLNFRSGLGCCGSNVPQNVQEGSKRKQLRVLEDFSCQARSTIPHSSPTD